MGGDAKDLILLFLECSNSRQVDSGGLEQNILLMAG